MTTTKATDELRRSSLRTAGSSASGVGSALSDINEDEEEEMTSLIPVGLPKRASTRDKTQTWEAHEGPLEFLEVELPTTDELCDMLLKLPYFLKCVKPMLEQLVQQVKHVKKHLGQPLTMDPNGPMYVVIAGSVEVCVGTGPKTRIGKGACFNALGMLGLYDSAETFRPRRRTLKEDSGPIQKFVSERTYEVLDYTNYFPIIYKQDACIQSEDDGDKFCFFNVCPCSCPVHARPLVHQSSWMPMTVVAAENNLSSREGGVILLPITMTAIDDVRRSANTMIDRDLQIKKSIEQFRDNAQDVKNKWQIIMSKCWSLFPEAPPEALFVIAEMCELISIESGTLIVHEGESGEAGESLFIIESGMATVEKYFGDPDGTCVTHQIGRLRAGAIIGDIALIGAGIPRAASVRAKTTVEAIKLSGNLLLNTLFSFPGMVSSLRDRCLATINLLQPQLPTRTEVLASLRLFAACDLKFVNELANECERRTVLCGEVIMEEGSSNATLYVLEYGRCSVETRQAGVVAEVPMGNCFGERTLIGISKTANATIRVKTLAALVLTLPQSILNKTLPNYPDEAEHFERMKTLGLEGRIKGGQLSHIALFRQCSMAFIEALSESVEMRSYLPGQTVCVQGLADACQMFVIAGGRVVAERSGQRLGEMLTGATFGELAMLGFVEHRSVTCRALTFNFMLEISRSGFLHALEQHPEQTENFTSLDRKKREKKQDSVQWPCLADAPLRFLYLLDLYTERWISEGKDEEWTLAQSAILISRGYVFVVDRSGRHIGTLRAGQCLNLQTLVNSADDSSIKLQPSKDCRASVLSRETLLKVIAEFPEEEKTILKMIMTYLVGQACDKLSLEPGGVASLRLSPIFRALSNDFVECAKEHLDNRLYAAGSDIIGADSSVPCLFIVLSGRVCVEQNGRDPQVSSACVYGESVLLGTTEKYTCMVRAETVCIVQVLEKKVFDGLLSDYPADAQIIHHCYREARHCVGKHLLHQALMGSTYFGKSEVEFTRRLSEKAETTFFAPGEIIIGTNEDGVIGNSPCYLVLAGQVSVESQLGVSLEKIKAVDIFGEAGAPGSESTSSVSICAWEEGLVLCARISEENLEAVFEGFPDELDRVVELFLTRQKRYEHLEKRRRTWLQDMAVPALAQCPMFTGSSFQFLWMLAIPLCEAEYHRRQTMFVAGEPAHSMLIMLEGNAELLVKGERIGVITTGATIGEVAMFGLLPARTKTVRALSRCRVLEVTSQALRHALTGSYGAVIGEKLKGIVKERQHQTTHGIPMTSLDIGARADDLSVRAIAAQAKRCFYAEGETWWPTADSDPNGSHFSIVVHGKAILEKADARRSVMVFNAGSMILEGMAAEYGVTLRAASNCEVYQIRLADFRTAIASVPSAQKWIYRFKLLDKEVESRMHTRLAAVRGLTEGLAPHPNSEEIYAWRDCRDRNIRRAKDLRTAEFDQVENHGRFVPMAEQVENLPRLTGTDKPLPMQHGDMSRTEASQQTIAFRSSKSSTATKKNSALHRRVPGLSSYPSLRLPLLKASQSEGRLGLPRPHGIVSSKSAVTLPMPIAGLPFSY